MPPSAFDLVIFDLDGTLVETRQGICESVAHVLQSFGRDPLPLETVVRYVGNGARKLIERALGASPESPSVESGLARFVEHYQAHCLGGSELYPSVAETLDALAPVPLTVLTNKPGAPSETILQGLGIRDRFQELIGGDGPVPKKPDPRGLLEQIARWGSTPQRTLFVGDTSVDVETARAAGCPVAGALWGFRPGDFDEYPPDWRLERFDQLVELTARGEA